MNTLDIGYVNKNNQKNSGYKGKSETHYNQKAFEMAFNKMFFRIEFNVRRIHKNCSFLNYY